MNPWMMRAPDVEPVSIGEAKAFVGGVNGDEEFLLSCLLVSARIFLEGEVGRVFVAQQWGMRCAEWPAAGFDVPSPLAPVIRIDAVRVAGAPVELGLDPAAFAVEGGHAGSVLVARNHDAVEAIAKARNGVVVELTAGYGRAADAVPAALRRAVLELAAHWFEHREPISFGRGTLPVPPSVRALIEPYCGGDVRALPQRHAS